MAARATETARGLMMEIPDAFALPRSQHPERGTAGRQDLHHKWAHTLRGSHLEGQPDERLSVAQSINHILPFSSTVFVLKKVINPRHLNFEQSMSKRL